MKPSAVYHMLGIQQPPVHRSGRLLESFQRGIGDTASTIAPAEPQRSLPTNQDGDRRFTNNIKAALVGNALDVTAEDDIVGHFSMIEASFTQISTLHFLLEHPLVSDALARRLFAALPQDLKESIEKTLEWSNRSSPSVSGAESLQQVPRSTDVKSAMMRILTESSSDLELL